MGTLASCFKKAGAALSDPDKNAILTRQAELRASGVATKDAAAQAVDELISNIKADLRAAGVSDNVGAEPTAQPVGTTGEGAGVSQPTQVGSTTDEQRKEAESHAKDVGGSVVWQRGPIALIRGYSMLNGQPVYSVAVGTSRSRVDVESYTGPLVTAEQKAELVAEKQRIEDADKAAHASNPFVSFANGNIQVSDGVPSGVVGVAQGWAKLLGLKANIYITTVDEARANKDKFTGPQRAVASSALDPNENGSMRKLPDGSYYVVFKPSTSKSKMLEVLAHELGHVHQREAYDKADTATQKAIRAEHDKWAANQKNQTAYATVRNLRAKTTGQTTKTRDGAMSSDLTPYWTSFSEWYADQVSRWAVSSDKPVGVVEQFFSRLGKAMQAFYYSLKGQKYLPSETMKQYLDKVADSVVIGEPAKFSKAGATSGTSTKEMATELRKFMRVDSLGKRVVVVQSASELPANLRKSVGVTGNTQAFVTDGKAYLIADNIAPGKARSVFLHEVGAHLGMENLLGDQYDNMVDKIVEWAGKNDNSLESKLAVRALQRVRSAGTPDAQANTELVAYFIEEAVDAGIDPVVTKSGPLAQFMRMFREVLKAALNRMGYNTDTLTAQDFVDVAYGLARMEMKMDATMDSDTARSVARWSDVETNNPVGREQFLKRMYRKMQDAYDSDTSPDDAVEAFLQGANAQEQSFIRALKKDDYLGFDYPHQAIEAILDDVQNGTDNFDLSPQLKAAISRAGNVQFSKASTLPMPAYMEKAPSELKQMAQGVGIMLKDWTFTRGAFTRDLLQAAEKLIPAAKTYREEMQAAKVESTRLQRQVSDILERADGLDAKERGTGPDSVNVLIRDMTYGNKWAFSPSWYTKAKVDADMAKRFNAMSPAARKVVEDVFRHGHETLKAAQQAALDSIKSEVDPLIATARAKGDMDTVKELERAKAKADGKFRRMLEIRGTTPYAPLKRFGNWAVVVKSQMYLDAESNNDEAALEKLITDGKHYRVEFVSNQLVARARAKQLQGEVGSNKVYFFERTDANLLYGGDSMFGTFSRLRELAREKMDGESQQVTKALDNALAGMYTMLVAETSARTADMNRKNVIGATDDMLKAFATQGQAMAHFIGSLKTSGKVAETLRVMKGQLKTADDQAQASVLYSEILRRHAMGLDYEPNQLLDKSLAFNSYWSLITSPSYLLTNMTQPWVVSAPVIAARFGMGRTFSALTAAYKDIGRVAVKLVENPEAVNELAKGAKDEKEVQAAVQKLFDRGAIDISLGADLGSFTSPGESELSGKVQKAIRFPRTLVERGEMINRVATAVAAYRLARQSGMGADAATDYADKIVYETHGDYSAFNSPRVMRNAVGRFATQFRKFQLIQLSMYYRMIQGSFKGASKEERAIARKALGYSLGTMFALGGVVALPGYTAISFLLGAFGDDDEPDDPEATMRRALGGGAFADLVVRGAPNWAGLNIGNRIGAAGMLSILPYTDLEASRDGYKDILLGLAGPFFGGTLPKALDGIGLMANGDTWKGLEMLMPRGLADAARGVRFATEGITKRNGDVVLSQDEIGFMQGMMQGIGLPTKAITDNQMLRNSQFKADEFYRARTTDLKREYVDAYRSGDGAKMQEVRQRWMDTQKARKELGFEVQPLSTLLKAPQEQKKREAKPMNEALVQ